LANGSLATTVNGINYYIYYNIDASAGNLTTVGNDVALSTLVPEPTSVALLAIGAAGLVRRRRRAV